jgi:uncharacterized protein YecT (DUF1311 family)
VFFQAVILAATMADPCAQAEAKTQADANACWYQQAELADKALNATYGKVTAALRASNIDTAPLLHAQLAWIPTRDETCDYERSLYDGGSIVPAIYSACVATMTQARTKRLEDLLDAVNAGKLAPSGPADAKVDAELNRVYGILLKRTDAKERGLLVASEADWLAYRDKACAIEGPGCSTQLEEERIELLKSSWLDCDGDTFK